MSSRMAMLSTFWLVAGAAVGWGIVQAVALGSGDSPPKIRELGRINWQRDFTAATELSRAQDKPLLILFQEVPGCATCVGYGEVVLSHPLLVEAAETFFIPVAIQNNTGGADRAVLESFHEPAMNNPVVRIVSTDRTELAPRLTDDYSYAGLAGSMVAALEQSHREVPTYLKLLLQEERAHFGGSSARAVFTMPCFWSGEANLGGIDGVIRTQPGFIDKLEVVQVDYNTNAVNFEQLKEKAKAQGYAPFAGNGTFRLDEQPKFYIAQSSSLKYLPMTHAQASRVNSALEAHADYKPFLSPRQIDLLRAIGHHPHARWDEVIDTVDFAQAWRNAAKKAMAF